MANTHLLVDGGSVCGVKSAMRVLTCDGDVYVPVGQQADDPDDGWLPIGGALVEIPV